MYCTPYLFNSLKYFNVDFYCYLSHKWLECHFSQPNSQILTRHSKHQSLEKHGYCRNKSNHQKHQWIEVCFSFLLFNRLGKSLQCNEYLIMNNCSCIHILCFLFSFSCKLIFGSLMYFFLYTFKNFIQENWYVNFLIISDYTYTYNFGKYNCKGWHDGSVC